MNEGKGKRRMRRKVKAGCRRGAKGKGRNK
jgi:hypothetical protein